MVAPAPLPASDSSLDVILGLGVVLVFAASLARAFAVRRPGRGRSCAPPARMPLAAPPPGATEPARNQSADPASQQREPVAEAPEPELARLNAATLAPLARVLSQSRRLGAAEDRVACELAALPDEFWLVERDVLLDHGRIPFLVIGATGAFLICASDGAWTLYDLRVLHLLGDQVRQRLPGYDGHAHPAVCLAFDEMRPRAWFGGDQLCGHGGWVLGIDWLQRWIFGFGPQYGLRNGDIRRLDELSGPFWERRSIARLPASPNFG